MHTNSRKPYFDDLANRLRLLPRGIEVASTCRTFLLQDPVSVLTAWRFPFLAAPILLADYSAKWELHEYAQD